MSPDTSNSKAKSDKIINIIFLLALFFASFEIAIRNIILVLLFLFYLSIKLYQRNFNLYSTFLNKYVFAFLGLSLLSLLKAVDMGNAFGTLFSPILRYIIFYFIALELIEINKIKKYINIILAGKLVIIFYGLGIDFFTKNDFFAHRNSRGTFAGFAVIICLNLLITQKNSIFKKMIYIVGIVVGLTALTTYSRGANLGFVIGIILWTLLIILRMQSWKQITATLIILAILFTPLLSSNYMQNRFGKIKNYENSSSITARLEMYRTSLKLIRKNPILGIGIGNFYPRAKDYVKNELQEEVHWNETHQHPHNLYIQIALEQGIISLIIFLIMVFKAYQISYSNYKHYETNSIQFFCSLSFITMLTALLGHSLVDFTIKRSYIGIPLLVFFVLNYKLYEEYKDINQR